MCGALDRGYIAGGGVFSIEEEGFLRLVDLKTNFARNLVSKDGVKIVSCPLLILSETAFAQLTLGGRQRHLLAQLEAFRAKTTHPTIQPTDPSRTAYATWSPAGQSIAYVTDNDLYILPSPE